MIIELKQAAQQALSALEKSQPHPSNPVIELTNQDFIDHEETIRQLRAAIQQVEAQQPSTGEPVAIGYINEMGELVKYPAPCIWMGQDCPRAKADRATHECYQRIYTHPAPSVPDDVVRDAERYRWLRKTRFIWSDFRYISGVHPTVVGLEFQWFPTQAQKPAREDLDVAIDAAMLAAQDSA